MRRAIAVWLVVAVGLSMPTVASAVQHGRPATVRSAVSSPRADRALAAALAVFGPLRAPRVATSPATTSHGGPTRSATLVLRDLLMVREELSPADREVADALLSRPTDGDQDPFGNGYPPGALATAGDTCTASITTDLCIHWVERGLHAPPGADEDPSTIPGWIDRTVEVFEQVWSREIDTLGFRPPKSDATSSNPGPTPRLDVYLAELGRRGLYGYCTTDDPNYGRPGYRFSNFSAYCVIDDDFVGFALPPLPSLRATAAHEFLHASQFAYDITEDAWFMEGTAAWVEDEVFDTVNDNLQFLSFSQLRKPWIPVDTAAGGYRYGAWIFWRFLSERFGRGVVKKAWTFADGARGSRDLYSLRAAEAAVKGRGSRFRNAFAEYGAWNVRPSARFQEGARYGVPRVSRSHGVTRANDDISPSPVTVDHLSHREIVFRPRAGVASDARLRVRIDGPPLGTGAEATVVLRWRDGRSRFFRFRLTAAGSGTRIVPFGRRAVASATLVLTNASTRTSCWKGTGFSCHGRPRDDHRAFSYAGRLMQ